MILVLAWRFFDHLLQQTMWLPISCLLPGAGFCHLIGQLVSSPLHLLQLIAHVRVLSHGSGVGRRGAWLGASGMGWPRNLERSRFDHMSVATRARCCALLGEALSGPYSVSMPQQSSESEAVLRHVGRELRCFSKSHVRASLPTYSGARYLTTHEAS